ncbi:hypothetical protein [Arachidicoccus sp.]|jgi:hypothetical protein|uniref:hypothetical protein n=1 Tax=Arachidicoccus sp. TaxID=1872624 RepID=UPI003D2523F7
MLQKRDLIILSKSFETSVDAFEKEVYSINCVLYTVESMEMFCIVNEIIDINRYKIIDTPFLIQKVISDRMKPFVFVYNKN